MKFTGAILALVSVSGAAAFDPRASPPGRRSQLFSSERGPGAGPPAGTPSFANAPSTFSNAPSQGIRNAGPMSPASAADAGSIRDMWDNADTEIVQGGSLRTWSFMSPSIERIQVLLRTNGRPLNADVELWQGPDNTPQKMAVYLEDGSVRPFNCVIESPRGSNTVAVRNTAQMEFPLETVVEPDIRGGKRPPLANVQQRLVEKPGRTIQGGAIVTFPFDPSVQKVSVCLKTDGRPLNARIELLQGPNNLKQVIEAYTEDGYDRPFMMVIDTPNSGNVVRIVNTATVEFPLSASVDPFLVEDRIDYGGPGRMQSGANDFFFSK